jgi:hypothetical protein
MKGQAAMEYLMTYGWAILIVIAVVVALYAMGVFRIGAGAQPCSPCFPSGSAVAYVDHNANVLVLRVGPRDLAWINVTNQTGFEISQTGPFSSGSDVTFSSSGTFGGDNAITVEFAYKDTPDIVHTLTATLHGG